MKYSTIAAALALALGVAAPAAQADITIGLNTVLSGPQGVIGQDQVDGFKLALEQLDGKFGGQKVNLIIEDDQLKPDVGSQILQKFLERDKVDAVVGLGFSNVLMATHRRIKESGIPALTFNSGPGPVAGKMCLPNLFALGWQNDYMAEAMGQYMQDLGMKNVALMTSNYQAGRDKMAGFKRYYKGNVASEVYTPMSQLEFSAEISKLQADKPDGLFVFYTGGVAINLVRQMNQASLTKTLPSFSDGAIEANTLAALKTQADGQIWGATWSHALDYPRSQAFVKAFEAKYGRTPSEFAANAYDTAYLLDHAAKKLDGKVSDRKALTAAIKQSGSEFPTVRAKFAFNNNNMPIENVYAFKAVVEGGQIVVKKIATVFTDHKDGYYSECPL
jgi:branched-chain amino acid transport system substrate-binding protein